MFSLKELLTTPPLNVAIDIGTCQVKALSNRSESPIVFPSVYKAYMKVSVREEIPRTSHNFLDNLVIDKYAVGNSALMQRSPVHPVREGEVMDWLGGRLLVKAALGLLAHQLNFKDKVAFIDHLIIGTTATAPESDRAKIERYFTDKQTIRYRDSGTGVKHKAKFYVKNCKTTLSSLGTYLNQNTKSCLIVDVGHGSVNVLAIEDNQIVAQETYYRSIDDVLRELAAEVKYPVTGDEIFSLLKTDELYVLGNKVNIQGAKNRKLRDLAWDVSSRIVDLVTHRLPVTCRAPSKILITGGGSILLSQYLYPKLRRWNVEMVNDPVTSNVRGLLRYGGT